MRAILLALPLLAACAEEILTPTPEIDGLEPPIVCNDQIENEILVHGKGFTPAPENVLVKAKLRLPDLWLEGEASVGAESPPEDKLDLDEDSGVRWNSAEEMAFDLTPEMEVGPGVYTLYMANLDAQDGDGKPGSLEGALTVVPPPSLAAVEPNLLCHEQENVLSLSGAAFLVLDGVTPTVQVGSWSGPADSASGCEALSGLAGGELCTGLEVTVPANSLDEGVLDLVVTNPAPADCLSTEIVQLDSAPAPVVEQLLPPDVCTESDEMTVEIQGSGYLELADGTWPTVTIGGDPYPVSGIDGCAALAGPSGASSCTSLFVDLPAAAFPVAGVEHPVIVTNPPPADCSSNSDVTLGVVEPPTITSIVPNPVCDSSRGFTVHGTDFPPGSEVYIDGNVVDMTTWISDTELLVETNLLGIGSGLHDVTVLTPNGCEGEALGYLDITAGPILFFVDPPVIYSQITTQISLFVGGISGTVVSVDIEEDATGTVWPVPNFTFDGNNTIFAEIEAGNWALPEGPYTVYVEDDSQCVPFLENAFFVEDDLTLAVTAVDPEFGWTNDRTAVDVLALDTASLPTGQVNFRDLPRVYLNPVAGGVATAVSSLSFQDETLVTAVVPSGLPVGAYDVIVVNPPPGNEIGLLPGAFQVTTDAPPTIDSVAPTRLDKSNDTPATIFGDNFRNPTVEMVCQEPGAIPGAPLAATVTASTGTTIDATMPSNGLTEGTVCVVRVTNDDGLFADYSAVSVGSPSGNLFAWLPGLDMVEARHAPAAVTGRATTRARYLYAIGGDDGTTAGASDTIELSPLDAFGNMRPWRALPIGLPGPRTLAKAVQVGRYVYLVGGNDGTTALDTVDRARILDPDDTPRLDTLGLNFGGGTGLDGGRYTYRISAVYDASEPGNPGGESMASDPIVVNVPDVPDKIHLDLTWTQVNSTVPVAGYNVYRSPVAGSASSTEEFLAFTPTATFTDVGDATTAGIAPLPPGALGAWHTVAVLPGTDSLDAAREAPGVQVGFDPSAPDSAYLYVAGGRDGNGTLRDTIHFLPIDAGDPDQAVGSWTTLAQTLGTAREAMSIMILDDRFNTLVGQGESWLYFGFGRAQAGWTSETEAAQIQAGGDVAMWSADAGSITPGRGSYYGFAANDFLYVIAGERQGAGAMADGSETSIGTLPDLDGWNSLGGSTLSEPRIAPGGALESAVVFVVGGMDNSGTASATTDYTNF